MRVNITAVAGTDWISRLQCDKYRFIVESEGLFN